MTDTDTHDARTRDSDDATETSAADDPVEMSDLFDEFEDLEELVESDAARQQLEEARRVALEIDTSSVFGKVIHGYDRTDLSEAVLGSLLFGIPMFVESGTNEIGAFVATHPLYFVVTHVIALVIAVGILYVADVQDVRVHRPILGVVPRRLVGTLTVPLLISLFMMTVWGRVSWAEPWLAVCTVSVAFVPMAIGAALGDILPGS